MIEQMTKIVDEYLDKFIASDLILIKIKNEDYPMNSLKKRFLERIKERDIQKVTSYTFLGDLYLEKL